MCLLNNLPVDLFLSLLSAWLTVVDVAHLDSAFCSHTLREEYLDAAYRFGEILLYPEPNMRLEIIDPMTTWIFARCAPVSGFIASGIFLHKHHDRAEYLQKHGRVVKWLEYDQNYVDDTDKNSFSPSAFDIAQYCGNLEQLITSDRLVDKVIVEIIEQCPLIHDLAVTNTSCTNEVIIALLQKSIKLTRVELVEEDLDEELLIALVHANPGIVHFNTCSATERFLHELAPSCSNLMELCIGYVDVSNASVCFLLNHCAHMVNLALDTVTYMPSTVETKPITCPALRELGLHEVNCSTGQLGDVLRACAGLTLLDIWNFTGPLDVWDLDILPMGARFSALRILSICGSGGFVEDDVLLDVGVCCTHLRVLKIPYELLATTEGLCIFALLCLQLEELDVEGCPAVTDSFLAILALNCSKLKMLSIAKCAVTDLGVAAVMRCCPDLVALNVEDCEGLTQELVREVERRYDKELHGPGERFLYG